MSTDIDFSSSISNVKSIKSLISDICVIIYNYNMDIDFSFSISNIGYIWKLNNGAFIVEQNS